MPEIETQTKTKLIKEEKKKILYCEKESMRKAQLLYYQKNKDRIRLKNEIKSQQKEKKIKIIKEKIKKEKKIRIKKEKKIKIKKIRIKKEKIIKNISNVGSYKGMNYEYIYKYHNDYIDLIKKKYDDNKKTVHIKKFYNWICKYEDEIFINSFFKKFNN